MKTITIGLGEAEFTVSAMNLGQLEDAMPAILSLRGGDPAGQITALLNVLQIALREAYPDVNVRKLQADLAGLKIRTLPNPVITECLRLMGAAATPLAFGEIYTALQAGVLDGLEHDPPTILASKFYETSKHYALTQHNFSPLATYFSDATFTRMDPKLREGFLDAASKAGASVANQEAA